MKTSFSEKCAEKYSDFVYRGLCSFEPSRIITRTGLKGWLMNKPLILFFLISALILPLYVPLFLLWVIGLLSMAVVWALHAICLLFTVSLNDFEKGEYDDEEEEGYDWTYFEEK